MWFLHVFGNNVEDSMGHGRFLAFYILCGLVAALTQTLVHPGSTIPMLGASGAIGGVMGAYVILYPLVRVHMFIFLGLFFFRYAVPAYFMLGYWFLLQVLSGLPALSQRGDVGGTAFWAHVGGFAAGMLFVFFFQNRTLVAQHRAVLASHPHYGRIR
jgi:membrane associated rhomboid family serine protease